MDGKCYIFFSSDSENVVFSSYRLSNPDRIVLEINGYSDKAEFIPSGPVLSISKSENNGITRFIFTVKENSQYTVLNRKNALLIGFSEKLFIEDGNFDSIYAVLQKSKEKPEPEEKLIASIEKKSVEKKDESVLVSELMQDLDSEKKQKEELKKKQIAENAEKERLMKLELEKAAEASAEKERIALLEKEKAEAEVAEREHLAQIEREKALADAAEKERIAKLELEKKTAAEAAEKERIAQLEKERIAQIQLEKEKAIADAAEKERIAKLELEKRAAAEAAEKERIAKLEKEKAEMQVAVNTKPELRKSVKTEEGDIIHLKVTKAEPEKKLSESLPELPVKKLEKKGVLKNIYFRKFPEFSRVTMELTGETDYQFREIKGGYVIDVHNFEKIPKYLLNIIDTRAFKAEVEYIYPKKVGDILKIYIKTDAGMAVRKSEENNLINFDFYKPTIQ